MKIKISSLDIETAIGKKKAYEEIEEMEPVEVTINFTGKDENN